MYKSGEGVEEKEKVFRRESQSNFTAPARGNERKNLKSEKTFSREISYDQLAISPKRRRYDKPAVPRVSEHHRKTVDVDTNGITATQKLRRRQDIIENNKATRS